MKKTALLLIGVITLGVTSCRSRSYQGEIIKETYIHKYGVPVPKKDWDQQGRDGQVVQLSKDGVTITRSYQGGFLHGKTLYTFPNSSTLQKVQTFEYGALISEVENFPSGLPFQEKCFKNGYMVKLTGWYEDGTPSLIENYSDTRLVYGEYRNPLNVVETKVEHGRGIRLNRNLEGELISKDNIQNGEMVERITYYANGDPSAVIPYVNGLIHGQKMTFLVGGLPNTIEQWVHDKQEGITICFQNGEKISEVSYVQGKKNGIEKRFRNETELVSEVSWKNGFQHGPTIIYTDGIAKTQWYHEGTLTSRNAYERMNLR